MSIPDLVRTTVLGRMRRLDRVHRRVVMCASVIGQRFDLALLTAAVACTEADVCAALARACALELIVVSDADRNCYAFRHALTRDVIYAELMTARTRPLHRRVVRGLEHIAARCEMPIEDLAYHSWAAGDVRRGMRYNELAGDRAAAVFAETDARIYYNRAKGLSRVASHAYVRLSSKLAALDATESDALR